MICRLCLNNLTVENERILFDTQEASTETRLVKMIAKYLSLEISHEDIFSTKICQECCEHLEDFHKFWMLVDDKQKTLRNEFLEIKCDINWSTDDDIVLGINNDEKLIDMTNICQPSKTTEETVFVGMVEINEEFAAASKLENNDSTDDDIPLLNLKVQMKSKTTKKKIVKKPTAKIKVRLENIQDNKSSLSEQNRTSKYEKSKHYEDLIANYMKLNCDLCEFIADTFTQLRLHFNVNHNKAPYVNCCGKMYSKPSKLVDHIRFHQNPNIYKCKICHKTLRTKACLQLHINRAHCSKAKMKRPQIMRSCTKCERKFSSEKRLENHLLKHENDNQQFPCEFCDKSFANQYRLRRHIEAIHEGLHPHVCDTCGKKFKFKPSFDRHLLEHQGIVGPAMQCQLCGVWMKNEQSLRLHRSTHDNKNCMCHLCGKICSSRTALRGHIIYAHKLQYNLRCSYCDKTFKQIRNLQEHMAIHTGAQLYTCLHCSKEFRSKSNMYAHTKRKHVDEWEKAKIARSNDPTYKQS